MRPLSRATPLDRALLSVCAAALGLTVLYPTVRLLVEAAQTWNMATLTQGDGPRAILNTLLLGFATVAGAGITGTALAFLLTRYSFPGRGVLAGVAYLPFTLPPLVGVLSFWYIIGQDGFVPRLIERLVGADLSLRGFGAVLLIHVYSFYVYFYAMVSAALEGIDVAQLEAARTLGARPWRVFTRVTLPLLRPALAGASLLAFMSSGASFSAPYFFSENFPVLSTRIYQEQFQGHGDAALTLALVLAAISLAGVLLFRSARRAGASASKGVRRPLRSRTGRTLAALAAWGAVLLLLVPHLTVVWMSFADHRAWFTQIVPTKLTLDSYARILTSAGMLRPILNSLWMSAAAASATVVVALAAGYLAGRRRPGGRTVNFLVMIPWALPGSVIAMNLIVAFNDPWLPLYGTVWMLPLAYFVRSVPLLARMCTAVIEPFDASLVEAGRTLGASRAYCFRRLVLPLIAPAVAAGAALVFAQCLGEFVASILLYGPANRPISVMILEQWNGSGIGAAFAYSVFLVLLVVSAFLLSRRLGARPV